MPRVALAQKPDRVRRIGVLMGLSESDPEVRGFVATFVEELARSGWIDGRNAPIERRWTNADIKRTSALAKELLAGPVGRKKAVVPFGVDSSRANRSC